MDDNTTPYITANADKMAAIERYLSLGWALVPLHYIRPDRHCSCGNAECRSAGKHPVAREWQRGVNRDPDYWVGALACAPLNIGIATGAPSGHWVLDYDPTSAEKAGSANEAEVVSIVQRLVMPHTQTGGGGNHWRFELPADFEVTNRRGTLPAGLDVRGTGGQVVAPPSVSGKGTYVELTDAPPYAAPAWLLDMIRPAQHVPTTRSIATPAEWSPSPSRSIPGSGAPEGDRGPRYARAAVNDMLTELREAETNRNDLAFRVACRIVEFLNAGWFSAAEQNQVRRGWVDATGAHPLGITVPMTEIASIWQSAVRRVGATKATLPPDDPTAPAPLGPALPPWEPPPFPYSGNGAGGHSPNGTSAAAERPTLAAPLSMHPPTTSVANGAPTSAPGVPRVGTEVGIASVAVAADDPWETAVTRAMSQELVRREAKRRIAEIDAGDRAARVASLRAELLTPAAMRARPRLRPLVEGLLYRNTLARINGASGCGKSFVTLDLAARVAASMPWAGRATHGGTVVYLVAEGDEGVGGRLDAWEAHHGTAMQNVLFMPRPVQAVGSEWDAWVEVLVEVGPALVVVDTQARVSVGADENDARVMGELVHALDALRSATGACVLLVHHTGRAGSHGRGSTAVTGALQTELLATRNGRQILIRGAKSKDDAEPDDVLFELIDVAPTRSDDLADGRPVLANVTVRPLGVVPVWSGDIERADVPDDGPASEPVHRRRARALFREIRRVYAVEGGTRAEIMSLFFDKAVPDLDRRSSTGRDAWRLAWRELIELGLIAKQIGESRFTVVMVEDQRPDGVLTSNRGSDGMALLEPAGYEVRGVQDPCYAR